MNEQPCPHCGVTGKLHPVDAKSCELMQENQELSRLIHDLRQAKAELQDLDQQTAFLNTDRSKAMAKVVNLKNQLAAYMRDILSAEDYK